MVTAACKIAKQTTGNTNNPPDVPVLTERRYLIVVIFSILAFIFYSIITMATEADQLLGTLNDGHHRRSEERMNRSNRLTRMGLMSVFVVILGMFTVFLKRANDHNDEDSTFQGTRFNALGGSIYPSLSSSQ